MTAEQLEACSSLFSKNYGFYSGKDDARKKGQRIKLSPDFYRRLGENPNMYVSLCYDGNKLLGQAFFLRKELINGEKCTWVTQLVVHHFYRNRKIATRLLLSAWGFSDYYAWGLATTNAITVKTLESVTWREVNPVVINNHIKEIGELCDEIPFADKKQIHIDKKTSQIFTNFYPEFQRLENSLTEIYVKRFGDIQEGYEWLAFTFQQQNMIFDEQHWNQMLDFSEYQLEDAYSRMNMSEQKWAHHTSHEIDFVEKYCSLKKKNRILDMGCGQGRHAIELAKRRYIDITAYDFSPRLISKAKELAKGYKINFEVKDCRHLQHSANFDTIICLYDVIGSFRSYEDNVNIIRSIYGMLKRGGKCVVSVMNMELTDYKAINKVHDVIRHPRELLKLKASHIMQSTGNVFNPEYFLLDTASHLVYRKEQFDMDGELSSEYVIADYRFTREQIKEAFEQNGFSVICANYVGLGAWESPLCSYDEKAKEILIIAEKI